MNKGRSFLFRTHRELTVRSILICANCGCKAAAGRCEYSTPSIRGRSAILLIGGDKTGEDRFYERMVPSADQLYDVYISEIRKEGLIP